MEQASPNAVSFLNLILPFLLAVFIWFAISFYMEIKNDPLRALDTYSPMIEYLMMSLFITVTSGTLIDMAICENEKK